MQRIDLHTHSTASDGTDSPAELVVAAAQAEPEPDEPEADEFDGLPLFAEA